MSLYMAMVLLSAKECPSASMLDDYYKQQYPSIKIVCEKSILSFSLDGINIVCALMEAPIPKEELEGPIQTTKFWNNATEDIQNHTAHLVVTASGETEPKNLAFQLTKAIEGILQCTYALGVYWGAATNIIQKDIFIEFSKNCSIEYLPLYLWIDFRCFKKDKKSYALFTTGMKALGFKEIEVFKSQIDCSVLIDKSFNLSHYLLDNGDIIRSGHTIGFTKDEKIKIIIESSFVNKGEFVYALKLF
jgi:hypothetical protein